MGQGLFPHRLLHPRQQSGNVQMLRALRQAFTAGNARGCRVAALHGRHRDGVVRHRPLLVPVQDIVVVHVGEDVADGDVVRTGDALVAARAVDVSRCVSVGVDGCTQCLTLGEGEHVGTGFGGILQVLLHIRQFVIQFAKNGLPQGRPSPKCRTASASNIPSISAGCSRSRRGLRRRNIVRGCGVNGCCISAVYLANSPLF